MPTHAPFSGAAYGSVAQPERPAPTQVQIEAALDAYAEVIADIVNSGRDLVPKDRYTAMLAALTAAAEAGEQPQLLKEAPDETIRRLAKEILTISNDTIEQCAQEGTEFLKGLVAVWRKENGKITRFDAADCLEQAIEGYAAAIRAMKEAVAAAGGPKDDPEKQTLIDNDW